MVGPDHLLDVGLQQFNGGHSVLEHQGRVADAAEQGREPAVAARHEELLAVVLGPRLDLANQARAVLGLPDTRLRCALQQQQSLVVHVVGVDSCAVQELACQLQRRPRVVAQELLDALDPVKQLVDHARPRLLLVLRLARSPTPALHPLRVWADRRLRAGEIDKVEPTPTILAIGGTCSRTSLGRLASQLRMISSLVPAL